jgi:hypothetical protein
VHAWIFQIKNFFIVLLILPTQKYNTKSSPKIYWLLKFCLFFFHCCQAPLYFMSGFLLVSAQVRTIFCVLLLCPVLHKPFSSAARWARRSQPSNGLKKCELTFAHYCCCFDFWRDLPDWKQWKCVFFSTIVPHFSCLCAVFEYFRFRKPSNYRRTPSLLTKWPCGQRPVL